MNRRIRLTTTGILCLILYVYAMTLGVVFGKLAYTSFLVTADLVLAYLIYLNFALLGQDTNCVTDESEVKEVINETRI